MTVFDEGRSAHERGLPRSVCPHAEGSPERREWLSGWETMMSKAARAGISSPTSEPMDALRSAGLVRSGAGPTKTS